jgi:hypothetical protein
LHLANPLFSFFGAVVSPFYGLCEISEKATAIYGVWASMKPPNMVLKQNWRNYSKNQNCAGV